MSILSDLLEEIKISEFDEQVKIICDKIMEEESPKSKNQNQDAIPKRPNIFLAVEYESNSYKICYLCLEREFKEEYIVSAWEIGINLKRVKTWGVLDNNKPEKIIKYFAEILKYVRGE